MRPLLAALLLALATLPARASEALWRALAQPGHVAMMRHATAPGTGDPPGFQLGECATQRNLDESGRAEARTLGERFRAAGIVRARILSSRWCRCLETPRLLELGPVETAAGALDSFFGRDTERPDSDAALRRLLAGLPRGGGPVVLVTHQVNATALTGAVPRPGEIIVLRLEGDGTVATIGRIPPG